MPTKLVYIANESPHNAHLRHSAQNPNGDPYTIDLVIDPQSATNSIPAPLTFPPAADPEQFAQNHIALTVGDRQYHIWQHPHDHSIHYTQDGQWAAPSDANTIPGIDAAPVISLTIGADGQLRGQPSAHEDVAEPAAETFAADPATMAPPDLADPTFDFDELPNAEDVPEGQRIDHIYKKLNETGSAYNDVTYSKTENNLLGPDWLIQTPNYWGKPAKDLPHDHSHHLGTHIRELILKANNRVDITTLDYLNPDGWFTECIAMGLAGLIRKKVDITVRILIGVHPLGGLFDTVSLPTIESLKKWLPDLAGSKLRIYVAGVLANPLSWNHSKIIVADGTWAIVGGHNLWWQDYLCWAPVNDVSMQIEGPAARCTQNFCNRLWQHVAARIRQPIHIGVYSHMYDGPSGRIVKNAASVHEGTLGTVPRGSTTILAVGRTGSLDWSRANQSDTALYAAMSLAKKSIKFSQQDMLLGIPVGRGISLYPDFKLMNILAAAILRAVEVHVVLTNPGATSGAGEIYSTGATIAAFASYFTRLTVLEAIRRKIPEGHAYTMLGLNFKVAPIRFSDDAEWPAARVLEQCGQARSPHQIANHSKVWIVDDHMFYIGSQNTYPPTPASHQEFGWIVEGKKETDHLLAQYWNPLWHWSSRQAFKLPMAGGAVDFAALDREPEYIPPGQ